VRFTPYFLIPALLLTSCRREEKSRLSPKQEVSNKLAGTWVFEPKYAYGSSEQKETVTVASDGSYITVINLFNRKIGPRTIRQEGTWRVEDGFLIDTITKDTQTNCSVPRTSRFRIVRIDEGELELDDTEKGPGAVYPTNQLIWHKQMD
jgi:hypothetical protein